MLQRKDIKKKIASICKYNEDMLYSSVVSALKSIVFSDNLDGDISKKQQISNDTLTLNPNLSQCAEIKIPKSGQLELKFINKLTALDMLIQLMNQKKQDSSPADFYNALNSSICTVDPSKEGDSDEI